MHELAEAFVCAVRDPMADFTALLRAEAEGAPIEEEPAWDGEQIRSDRLKA